MSNTTLPTSAITPALLTTDQAAQYLGLAKSTLQNQRSAGVGPRFKRLGRSVRYARATLDEYVANLPEGAVVA